jgi:hypothetical protein
MAFFIIKISDHFIYKFYNELLKKNILKSIHD